jgi:hypothetical protein
MVITAAGGVIENGDNQQGVAIQRDGIMSGDVFGADWRINRLLSVKERVLVTVGNTGLLNLDRKLAGGPLVV